MWPHDRGFLTLRSAPPLGDKSPIRKLTHKMSNISLSMKRRRGELEVEGDHADGGSGRAVKMAKKVCEAVTLLFEDNSAEGSSTGGDRAENGECVWGCGSSTCDMAACLMAVHSCLICQQPFANEALSLYTDGSIKVKGRGGYQKVPQPEHHRACVGCLALGDDDDERTAEFGRARRKGVSPVPKALKCAVKGCVSPRCRMLHRCTRCGLSMPGEAFQLRRGRPHPVLMASMSLSGDGDDGGGGISPVAGGGALEATPEPSTAAKRVLGPAFGASTGPEGNGETWEITHQCEVCARQNETELLQIIGERVQDPVETWDARQRERSELWAARGERSDPAANYHKSARALMPRLSALYAERFGVSGGFASSECDSALPLAFNFWQGSLHEYRPDVQVHLPGVTVIVEADECCHVTRYPDDELARMDVIAQAVYLGRRGLSTVFIRLNCDPYVLPDLFPERTALLADYTGKLMKELVPRDAHLDATGHRRLTLSMQQIAEAIANPPCPGSLRICYIGYSEEPMLTRTEMPLGFKANMLRAFGRHPDVHESRIPGV